MDNPLARARRFADRFGLAAPVLMAPMAGACPPALAIAVANGGGMGACGALLMQPDAIADWARTVRGATNGAFQLNTWIPDAPPARDAAQEAEVRALLATQGPVPPSDIPDDLTPDFDAQCAAMIGAGPAVMSSIMGLYPPHVVDQMKQRGITWMATVTSVSEAMQAEAAGADVLIVQGMEAGGHRGSFAPEDAARNMAGLFALLPAIADRSALPLVATGGIADARGMAAALMLGASAVQIGTALLRTPEAATNPAWADALADTRPEDTAPTQAFSGRLGRAIRSAYVTAAADHPTAPYPVQRHLTGPMRAQATADGDITRMQAWAGQSAALAQAKPAAEVVQEIWQGTQAMLA